MPLPPRFSGPQVLLLNLVLDTLVAAYTRYNEETEEEEIKEKVEGICEAARVQRS